MRRKLGTGLLVVGACSACWIVPVLVALLGAGWAGALGASWFWIACAAVLTGAAAVLVRRGQRRRRAQCGCATPTGP
ncbi:MAG: hypothetical protein AB7V62_01175 [Thermoleophilia bacterium]